MVEKLKNIINNIEKHRLLFNQKHLVNLVAISKYSDDENISKLYSYGQRSFGENQVQQLSLRTKNHNDLPIEWHMVGILQKNKINMLIDLNPYLFQSLGDLELAISLDKKLKAKKKRMNVLLQINISGDKDKYGFKIEEVIKMYENIHKNYTNINLQGVMTTGINLASEELIKSGYEKVYKTYQQLEKYGAKFCSMGTSSDYKIAIESGSNLVRIGSEILTKRDKIL